MAEENNTNGNGLEAELFQADGYSGFSNLLLGVGDSNYDASMADKIDTSLELLNDAEITAICSKSRIVKRILDTYPNDASFGFPYLNNTYGTYGVTPEQITNYINDKLIDSESLSLEKAFRIASKKARKWGVHYLVLGINDGRLPSEPINKNSIKTFEFITLKNKHELVPDNHLNPSYYQFSYYFTSVKNTEKTGIKGNIKIHPDRVIAFYGEDLQEDFEGIFYPLSTLQSCIDAVLSRMAGLKQGKQLLTKKAILWAVLNPPQTIVNPDYKFAALADRLRKINLLANSQKMIGMNQGESIGEMQIDLAGIDHILAANDTELLAQSGLVRYKLFGESAQSGLSQTSAGIEQKTDHASRCSKWADEHWHDHLVKIYDLVCLAKDSPTQGRKLKGLSVAMRTHPDLSPNEWGELREKNSKWALPFLSAGVLTKEEVRMSFFDGSNLDTQLIPNIQLNQDYTQQLKDELVKPVAEIQTDELDFEQLDCSSWFEQTDENQTDESSYPFLVWFSDSDGSNKHRTPIAVRVSASNSSEARSKAATVARSKCTRHCEKIYAMRQPTEAEKKTARSGAWVRTGANHEPVGYKGLKGVGTPLKSQSDSDREEQIDSGEIFKDKALYQSCLVETKSKFDIYPSAYANAFLTKLYKQRYKEKHGSLSGAFTTQQDETEQVDDLGQWFKEDWVAINSSGEIVGACGDNKTTGKMKCLPKSKAMAMSKDDRAKLAKRKQQQDPDKDRKGDAINVSSKLKQTDEAIDVESISDQSLDRLLDKIANVDDNEIDKILSNL